MTLAEKQLIPCACHQKQFGAPGCNQARNGCPFRHILISKEENDFIFKPYLSQPALQTQGSQGRNPTPGPAGRPNMRVTAATFAETFCRNGRDCPDQSGGTSGKNNCTLTHVSAAERKRLCAANRRSVKEGLKGAEGGGAGQ